MSSVSGTPINTSGTVLISKALQLDANNNIISDIYNQVKTQDKDYAPTINNQSIKVTFEKILTNTNDITIYAKSTDTQPTSIEVYPVYTDEDGNQMQGAKLDTVSDGVNKDFSNISQDGKYRILLSNLKTSTDTFNLKINGSIDFDYIVDPTTYYWVGGTTNSNTSNPVNWSTTAGACANSANATAPAPGDTVHFVSNCTNNATINSALSVTDFFMDSGYTGTVSSGASLITSGDVTISEGTLNLNGYDITIGGNYTNAGTIIAGSGTAYFTKASGTQTLNS